MAEAMAFKEIVIAPVSQTVEKDTRYLKEFMDSETPKLNRIYIDEYNRLVLESDELSETISRLIIDSEGIEIATNRQGIHHDGYSRFESDGVRFGNYKIIKTYDGGLGFKCMQN